MPVSKMKWKKYTIKTTTEAEDLVSGMLMDLGMEGVQIEDVRRIVVADARGNHGVYVVPRDDLQIQLDAGVRFFEFLDEAGAVHAGAGKPVVRLGAVLADDDVQRDILGHTDGRAGNQHHERQHQGRKLLHEISSLYRATPLC